jgi:hypothetical protein
MKMFDSKWFLLAGCLSLSPSLLACLNSGFLPENDLNIPANQISASGLSEAAYHRAIDRVVKIYKPIVRNWGGNLVIERLWENGKVNAGTYRPEDRPGDWVVNMYGGYARHPFITEDAFMLVLCHEIGHHVGGAPKKNPANTKAFWSSTEGQSDYFATLKCLRKVFARDNNEAVIKKMNVPRVVLDKCRRAYGYSSNFAICVRSSMAGLATAKITAFSSRAPLPDFNLKDENVVTSIQDNHPAAQCRLDSYVAGATCNVNHRRSVSQRDEVPGTCHHYWRSAMGNRPLCWFKPTYW